MAKSGGDFYWLFLQVTSLHQLMAIVTKTVTITTTGVTMYESKMDESKIID